MRFNDLILKLVKISSASSTLFLIFMSYVIPNLYQLYESFSHYYSSNFQCIHRSTESASSGHALQVHSFVHFAVISRYGLIQAFLCV
jgi:hypothetical protein